MYRCQCETRFPISTLLLTKALSASSTKKQLFFKAQPPRAPFFSRNNGDNFHPLTASPPGVRILSCVNNRLLALPSRTTSPSFIRMRPTDGLAQLLSLPAGSQNSLVMHLLPRGEKRSLAYRRSSACSSDLAVSLRKQKWSYREQRRRQQSR